MNSLLVPIKVKAMISDFNGNASSYLNNSYAFTQLLYPDARVGQKIQPDSFRKTTNVYRPGIHLHWMMPDALTHGKQTPDGSFDFYALPDRWLVTRLQKEKTAIKQWIVESNYIATEIDRPDRTKYCNYGSRSIPDFTNAAEPKVWFLGRTTNYPEDFTLSGQYLDKLTALLPYDPYYTAYYLNCRNVFAFHDNLQSPETHQTENEATFTYVVCGYYENKENDPLSGIDDKDAFLAALREWKWEADANTPPKRLICHGLISGLEWHGKTHRYETGVPDGTPSVSVGNTSAEALSSLVEKEDPTLSRYIQSIMYDLPLYADKQESILQADTEIHRRTFRQINLHNRYDIIPEKNQTISPDTGLLLSKLNEAAERQNTLERDLETAKQEVYLAYSWYKLYDDPTRSQTTAFLQKLENYQKSINNIKSRLTANIKETNRLKDTLTDNGFNLMEIPEASFYLPNNPVIMLSGEGIERSPDHGEDGLLACRLSGQVVKSLTVGAQASIANPVTVLGRNLIDNLPEHTSRYIPDEINDLIYEAALIDTSNAGKIAAVVHKKNNTANLDALAEVIVKLQTFDYNRYIHPDLADTNLAGVAGFTGNMPSLIALNRYKPSFYPLFMDWNVFYYPADVSADAGAAWGFDGVDYTGYPGQEKDFYVPLTGRTVVTPHAVSTLSEMMQGYGFTENVKDIRNLNILSQELSGFNEQIISRKPAIHVPVNDPNGPVDKLMKELTGDSEGALAASMFYRPLRSGELSVNEIWLTDSFGRIKAVMNPAVTVPKRIQRQAYINNRLLLPPRVPLPIRLVFKPLIPSEYPVWESSSGAASAACPAYEAMHYNMPVFGWLMTNHMDKSVMIYEESGDMLGSLSIIIESVDEYRVLFRPAPGLDASNGDAYAADPHLNHFIRAIMGYAKSNPLVLTDFIKCLNRCTYSINHPSAGVSDSVPLLSGRPLALINAFLRLERWGLAPEEHSAERCLENVPEPLFRTYIGDPLNSSDGVIGFFYGGTMDTHASFHACIDAPTTPDYTQYIVYDHSTRLRFNETVPLTLLIDPSADIHIVSGYLPVLKWRVPSALIAKSLENLYYTMYLGPLLTEYAAVDLPLPAVAGMAWEWLERNGYQGWNPGYAIKNSIPETGKAAYPLKVKEGWVRLYKKREDE